jgi:hypothetical protein
MRDRPPTLPTTEEQRPPTEEPTHDGRPLLLAAFPQPVAVELPRSGERVGRVWMADAGIVDPKVSGSHVRFLRRGSSTLVEDVGSRNGTSLDGVRLAPHAPAPISDGAILEIGNTVLVFRESFAGSATPEPPLGGLVGPWGLAGVRRSLRSLPQPPVLNVLVEGETGTGKELLAREVARRLGREARFVPINVATIPRELFDGHLFGWERGAFSGSVHANVGVLRANAGGVAFFDELEALPLEIQPKLLRFLQFREVFSLGASRPAHVDVVVIAATNQLLAEMVEQNAFRRDLHARFNVRLRLPPLRDRPEDVYAIFEASWWALRGPLDRARIRVNADAVALMMRHAWPENVRELERLVMVMDPEVGLKSSIVRDVLGTRAPANVQPSWGKDEIVSVLAACGGNKSEAARRLGISRGKLIRLLEEYGVPQT